jgi:predicted component of type VI protein secretion system
MTLGKLFWLQPDNTIVEFPLKTEQNVIGRGNRCEVRIKHPGISTSHALIRITKEATTVEDLGSTNGTRVNGKRVQVHVLRHGDQIGVGRERLMYFAELDDAATFVQPKAIEPYVLPAPVGERVNTTAAPEAKRLPPEAHLSDAIDAALTARPAIKKEPVSVAPPIPARAVPPTTVTIRETVAPSPRASNGMPELDLSLLAALPMGTSLSHPTASKPAVAASSSAPLSEAVTKPAIAIQPVAAVPPRPQVATPAPRPTPPKVVLATPSVRPVSASVSVLSGPAAGKNYPLEQPSVTLGKEGKQVVEILRAGQTRWQIKQREGVTPAYINGDALVGARELAAGDVIELVGVRLRFDLALT